VSEYPPCVGSGMCCKRRPCGYGEPDETGGCRFLVTWEDDDLDVERYRCGKYDEIKEQPGADFSPAFGAGCCQPLFNERRDEILVALRARR
jgi:hypothetical protein